MFSKEFTERMDRISALHAEQLELNKHGAEASKEDRVLNELRLDDAWKDMYKLMERKPG